MVFGGIGFSLIEGRSIIDSAYFVIVTMATVGYGDVHPVTTGVKYLPLPSLSLSVILDIGSLKTLPHVFLEAAH
jgi:voltage-gated potassium channel